MRTLGVPYSEEYEQNAVEEYLMQAEKIAKSLSESGITIAPDKEVIAIIAYLHKLGRDISPAGNTKAKDK